MKSFFTLCTLIALSLTGMAQTDTTAKPPVADTTVKPQADTIRIGGMVIIKKGGTQDSARRQERDFPSFDSVRHTKYND